MSDLINAFLEKHIPGYSELCVEQETLLKLNLDNKEDLTQFNIEIVKGNLLDSKEDVIVHQCNCVTITPKGLSEHIFRKWPHLNIYIMRGKNGYPKRDKPGSMYTAWTLPATKYSHTNGQLIVNLFGQLYPSKSNYPNDTYEMRLEWFRLGLLCIEDDMENYKLKSIAFPYKIGCGLAGGNWDNYLGMIEDFSNRNPEIKVVIYKLN